MSITNAGDSANAVITAVVGILLAIVFSRFMALYWALLAAATAAGVLHLAVRLYLAVSERQVLGDDKGEPVPGEPWEGRAESSDKDAPGS